MTFIEPLPSSGIESALTEDDRRKSAHGVLKDGERLHFSTTLLRDGMSAGPIFLTDASIGARIDKSLKQWVKEGARQGACSPSDFLGGMGAEGIVIQIQKYAKEILGEAQGAGVASAMSMDSIFQDACRELGTIATDAASARAVYKAQIALREAEMRDGWQKQPAPVTRRKPEPAPQQPRPQLTGDAKADYEASREARQLRIMNAWRGN